MAASSLSLRGTAASSRVRGRVLQAHLQWVRDYFGDRVATRVLSVLPPPVATEINGGLPAAWCELDSLVRLDRAIAEVCGRNGQDVARELGRYTAHLELMTESWNEATLDPHLLFARAARRHADVHPGWEFTYVGSGVRAGRMSVAGAASFSPVLCSAVAGFLEQTAIIGGGFAATVTERSCRCAGDHTCTYDLSWQ